MIAARTAPRWEVGATPPPAAVGALSRALRLPDRLCAVLAARGVAEEPAARAFLRPLLDHLHRPEGLAGAERAAERLRRAARRGEIVLVHGDYDVDGICGAAVATRMLRALGVRAEAFVPHRLRDGYDLGEAGLARAREVGASVLLTVDCGIVAHEAVARAASAGIDVLVTDHHTPGDTLPGALAVVNPNRGDCGYPEKGLCGAAVAWKLCSLLAESEGMPLEDRVRFLDLVAVATVADLVPLGGENRVLARFGLRVLRETRNPGLRALLSTSRLTGREIEAGHVGFGLAPRMNAAGRVGDAAQALRLLLTDDPDEAAALADALEEHNRVRKEEDARTLAEALELLERDFDPDRDHGVVLAREGWHPGVIGIVASRVVERIHRPTVLVALDGERGRGSARSIPGFHLYDALRTCAPHLERFGGHAQAAGMDVRRERLDALREDFAEAARRRLEGSDLLSPRLRVDLDLGGEAALRGLDLRFCELLRHLGPHGIGNPRPTFLARGLRVADGLRTVGDGHLKLELTSGEDRVEAIGFRLAERLGPAARAGAPVDAVFQLGVNEYRGRRSVQARLLDLRPSAAAG